jgi:hypothetical protein
VNENVTSPNSSKKLEISVGIGGPAIQEDVKILLVNVSEIFIVR